METLRGSHAKVGALIIQWSMVEFFQAEIFAAVCHTVTVCNATTAFYSALQLFRLFLTFVSVRQTVQSGCWR